ncbi:hypothetical protein GOODEAATRI_018441 [Goodea atripinnis]|uniref:Uncharacterized protein n=1 Tax=Goodea atripinnis TaxID=208336 RepID=A0ABV0NLA6_9TELE
MHRYLGFEESLESPTDCEPHRAAYLGWQPDRIRVPFQLRTLSTLLEGLPPWLLSAPHSGSALSPDALSPWQIPTPHQFVLETHLFSSDDVVSGESSRCFGDSITASTYPDNE